MQTLEIQIFGKVQGVFFRKNAREKARELGITGTVENRRNGSVKAIATGSNDSLKKFLAWCKVGDPPAEVDGVEVAEVDLKEFAEFKILR